MDLEKLLEDIKNALGNLVTLEIVTALGSVKYLKNRYDYDWAKDDRIIFTQFDLLQGDIRTVMHPDFIAGEYQGVREYHAEREKQGLARVRENIEALGELVALINREFLKSEPSQQAEGEVPAQAT